MTDYKVTLTKDIEIGAAYVQNNNTYIYPNHAEYFRVKITAVPKTAADMTGSIFALQNTIIDPYKSTSVAQFAFVCSPYQLSEFPEDTPTSTGYMQFYRKDTIEVYFQSQRDANTFWGEIKLAVDSLVDRLERNDDSVLVAQTAIWVPDAPTTT
jgi:hypothetical protein